MTPGLRLNTASAHTWAAVVSGTAWKRHTLGGDGSLTAEYMRGPVIVWASRPGEGKALAPASPSALEVQVDRVNTAQVFERFYWATRGKVRPSVRWKSSRKSRKHEALLSFNLLDPCPIKTYPKSNYKHHKHMIGHSRYLIADAIFLSEGCEDDLRREGIRALGHFYKFRCFPEYANGMSCNTGRKILTPMNKPGWLLVIGLFRDLFSQFLKIYYARRVGLNRLIIDIIKAAFRAHLTRRVKPAPRRGRVRRPLYARPRPPSAPLAPPVS